jgi:LacI family transcriptional regulator
MATEHLIKLGHKNIACLASSHEIEDSTQRVEGYQAALDAHNINLPASFIEYGEPNNDGGETSMTNLLAKSLKMTAIVSYNDYMAAGAISVLQENSRQLPDEISIIGFDDGLIARYLQPRLTTVRYPIALMAEKAARLSIALARGEKDPSEVLMFSPTLVKRDSVQKQAD